MGIMLVSAIALCAAWAVARQKIAQAAHDYPPIGKLITVKSTRLHILDRGNGIPVVMLHGASSNIREWTASIFDKVAENHRAIAIDRPGHGWSSDAGQDYYDPRAQARLIHEALKQIDVERPILVGHSFAGTIVLSYALQFPDDVGGTLFLSGVSHPWPGGVGWYYDLAAIPLVGAVFANLLVPLAFEYQLESGLAETFHPNRVPKDYADQAAVRLYMRPVTFRTTAFELTGLKPIVREMSVKYHNIKTPLIALTGDRDRVIKTELHTPPLIAKVKGSNLRVLEDTGHMPHHTDPDAVISAIEQLTTKISK